MGNSSVIIEDSTEIANNFNKFFTEISTKLASVIPNQEQLIKPTSEYASFDFLEVDEKVVHRELTCINENKAEGLDGVPAYLA